MEVASTMKMHDVWINVSRISNFLVKPLQDGHGPKLVY